MKIGGVDINRKVGSVQLNEVRLGNVLLWQYNNFLDLFPADAAFAFIKLRKDYSGFCIKIRKTVSGTTTEQDIGFVGNGLDTSAIATFCGSADGFISAKYDQSTNGNNQTQSTASKQPKIYDGSSASMNLLNGLNAARYESGHVTNLDSEITPVSIFVISNSITLNAVNYICGTNLNGFNGLVAKGSAGGVTGLTLFSGGSTALGNAENSDRNLNILINNATNTKLAINGDSLTSASRQGDIFVSFVGNRQGDAPSFAALDGNIQFEAYYEDDQESNLGAIQSYLNNIYSLYTPSFLLADNGFLLQENGDKIIL